MFLMRMRARTLLATISLFVIAALATSPAHAFRCKSKIVKDGMHEQQVIAICGQPTTLRHIGYALRGVNYGYRYVSPGGLTRGHYPGYANFSEQVVVTEYVYNLGPRKLMRRLVFEGGVLVRIETIGYGYIEKKSR